MKKQIKGILSLLTATFIWGTAFVAQSVGINLIGPFTFQTIRCFLAVLFLFPLTFLFERSRISAKETAARWKNPRLWKTGLICGLGLFVAISLQQFGIVYTDPGKAGFLTAMYIVIVPILGIFLNRKPTVNELFSIFIAVPGLYLLSCAGVSRINIGDIYLIGCAFAFSVQIMMIDHLSADLDGLRLNCIQALVVAVCTVPLMLMKETLVLEDILSCWFPICYAGIFSMGIAYTLQIVGQQLLDPTTASLIMSMESVFAALGGWLILRQIMTAWELTGAVLVFVAVVVSQLPARR